MNNEKLIQAIESRSLAGVRHVLESRPDASVRSMPGNYVPLLLATSLGYEEIVQELLTGGAEVDVRNDDNDSALIIASRKGHVKVR
jgi:ankyrin repeat protein